MSADAVTPASVPGLRLRSIVLVGLSIAIGWGIRGNFGHEYGAMIAGMLGATAACLVSGREDWRARVPYFAMFGALGWGFGASISYMQVIAYTHSGHLPSQVFGFAGLFVIGFLWAGMGGAGAGFAAAADQKRLIELFTPLCWVLGGWLIAGLTFDPFLEHFESNSMSRHENALYWFDADWVKASTALLALFAFDLWSRRRDVGHHLHPLWSLACGAVYAFVLIRLGRAGFGEWSYGGIALAGFLALVGAAAWSGAYWRTLALALTGAMSVVLWTYGGPWTWRVAALALGLITFILWDLEHDSPWRLPVLAVAAVLVAAALVFCPLPWLIALAGAFVLSIYCFWSRYSIESHPLVLYAGGGALFGFVVQGLMTLAGLADNFARALVSYQGDMAAFPPERLMINWPQFFRACPEHLGWGIGLALGLCAYFALYGRFRSGASLLVHMAAGWLVAFILIPVLGGLFFENIGGLRMTPPRSDDWAGILGLFIGAMLYLRKNGLLPVAYAAQVSGTIGGLGFSGVQMLKLLAVRPGNPNLVTDPAVVEFWAFWQKANWHSWLEQSYGFVNGVALAVALGLLAARVPRLQDTNAPRLRRDTKNNALLAAFVLTLLLAMAAYLLRNGFSSTFLFCAITGGLPATAAVYLLFCSDLPLQRRTQIGAVAFTLVLLTYLNIVKNVSVWTESLMAESMKAPLLQSVELSTWSWFTLVYAFMGVAMLWLMTQHARRPIAMVPAMWLGRGQLLYLVFLWMMVVANFERALPAFAEQRILTEGVIFVNAIIVTMLVLVWPRDAEPVREVPTKDFRKLTRLALAAAFAALVLGVAVETGVTRWAYGDTFAGHAGLHTRFGPDASWRTKPELIGEEHR